MCILVEYLRGRFNINDSTEKKHYVSSEPEYRKRELRRHRQQRYPLKEGN